MILAIVDTIGKRAIDICDSLGAFVIFFMRFLRTLFSSRLLISKLFYQMNQIGVDSFNIVVLTGTFTGMVFALQSYIGFQRVGGEQFIGAVVALGLVRELGPVLSGLMVAGRAGSAITAELGTMRITEQIDALTTLRINSFQYLIVPRILGGFVIMPFLTIFSMIFGIVGGYMICVYVLGLSPEDYVTSIKNYVELYDVTTGLKKSAVFGLILSWVGCYKGFHTAGGAKGVGISTTQSVVTSSILILISNYFLTKMLENL